MTTTATFDRVTANANGVAPIPFNFQAISDSEVAVLRNNVPEIGTFTVQLNGDGTGTVTPLASWGADPVVIYSNPDFSQPADFARFGSLYPDQLVPPLDRLARTIISLRNRLDRSAPDASLRTDLAASGGSSLFGFLSSLAGSVARSGRSKLDDVTSIKDFGAVGNGVSNDTAALTAAVAAGREIFLPPGNYLIDPVSFTNLTGVKLRGAGRDVTKITLASTGTALAFVNCQWLQMSDLTLMASGSPQTLVNAIGIKFTNGSCNSVLERVNVTGFSLDGIRYEGTAGSHQSGHTQRDCYFLGNGRNQVYGTYCDDFTFDNVQHGNFPGFAKADFGLLMDNSGEGLLINTKSWYNKRAIKMLTCTGMRYVGVRAELSDFENLWLEGGYNHNFDKACRFYSPSQGGNGVSDNLYLKSVSNISIPVEATTWDASYGRYALKVDTGCDRIKLDGFRAGGFDATKGPISLDTTVTRLRTKTLTFNAAAVPAGSTVYLTPSGSNAGEGPAAITAHTPMQVVGIIVAVIGAPGAAKNFTYTFRKNGVDTPLTLQLSGAAAFLNKTKVAAPVPAHVLDEENYFSIKLVTDAAAAVTDHRVTLLLSEF